MCGIVFKSQRKGSAMKGVFKRYKKQVIRGTEGYGVVTVYDGKVKTIHRSINEAGIRKLTKNDTASTILFHHRNPSFSPNIIDCTHPIVVKDKSLKDDWLVVHNGYITNAESLKSKYQREGFKFTTEGENLYASASGVTKSGEFFFNDSESFAIDIVKTIEIGRKNIDSIGSIAFVALQYDKATKQLKNVYFGRNYQNPLVMEDRGDGLTLASEGKGKLIDANFINCYNFVTRTMDSRPVILGHDVDKATAPVAKTETKKDPANVCLLPAPSDASNSDPFPSQPTLFPKPLVNIGVVNSSISLYNESGKVERIISFRTSSLGSKSYLDKTRISIDDIDKITEKEWDMYQATVRLINNDLDRISFGSGTKNGLTPEERTKLQESVKKRFNALHKFSETITSRDRKIIEVTL